MNLTVFHSILECVLAMNVIVESICQCYARHMHLLNKLRLAPLVRVCINEPLDKTIVKMTQVISKWSAQITAVITYPAVFNDVGGWVFFVIITCCHLQIEVTNNAQKKRNQFCTETKSLMLHSEECRQSLTMVVWSQTCRWWRDA